MDEPKAATEPVDAELTLWRVFGISDVFPDAPPGGFTMQVSAGPKPDDLVTLTIGALPDQLTTSLRQWRAQLSGLLGVLTGETLSEQDRFERYEAELPNVQLPEFINPYPNWVVVKLSRPATFTGRLGATISWAADPSEIVAALDNFEPDANTYIDGVLARIIAPLQPTNLALQRYADGRALITAPDRLPLSRPNFTMAINDAGILLNRQPGYGATMWAATTAVLSQLPHTGTSFGKVTKVGARAFTAARAETDPLRRFVIAFAGLEALITAAEKDSRNKLTERIRQADASLQVEELFWPTVNEDNVYRNLVFRFAAVANVYSPATGEEDIKAFKELAKYRNTMFHGSSGDFDDGKSVQCTELLRRYLGLLAAAGL